MSSLPRTTPESFLVHAVTVTPPHQSEWRDWLDGLLAVYPLDVSTYAWFKHVLTERLNGEDCEHEPQLVYFLQSNGAVVYQEQCQNCGKKIGQFLRHADVDKNAAVPRNEWSSWESGIFEQMMDMIGDWWTHYDAYLQTPEWKARRRACIDAARGQCQRCRRVSAVQAHHLTYDNVGREYPSDLMAVCLECHAALTPRQTDT